MGGRNSKIYRSSDPDVNIPNVDAATYSLQEWKTHGDKVAAVHGATEITFKELGDQIRRFAASLAKDHSVRKGDVLALDAVNSIEWIVTFFGALYAGAVVTTLNPVYTPEEIAHQFQDAKPKVVVCDLAVLENVPPTLPIKEGVKDVKGIQPLVVIAPHGTVAPDGCLLHEFLVANGDGAFQGPSVSAYDVAVLPYSSGTTGNPKGVCLTHRNIIANCVQNHVLLTKELEGDDASLIAVLPFFHIYGMQVFLLSALSKGCKLAIMSKFDPKEFLQILVEQKVTTAFVVPPIVNFMAKHPALDSVLDKIRPNLRTVLSGAAPLGAELGTALEKRLANGCKIKQGYGMTEMSPVTHVTPESLATPENSGAAGALAPNTIMKILKEDGSLAGAGERGEICIKVMKGYLNNPSATREVLKGGWLHTGDVGFIDEKGLMTVVDRCKELIKVKSLQVAPAEVEAVLQLHPSVADAAVVGIPDERSGEVPKAFIVVKEGSLAPTLPDIQSYVKEHLAPFKVPEAVEIVLAIPKSASGKILRRMLRPAQAEQ